MAFNELDITVTNTATIITSLSGGSNTSVQAQYVQIVNPNAVASIAFTVNGATPVVNGVGVTIAPTGAETFDSPDGVGFPLSALKFVSSTASQAVTILWA